MRDRKTYFLDLQTLLLYLGGQSCELTTELKVSEKATRGSIWLKEGKIVHCLLSFQNGSQISGEQAYRHLEACTQWQIELEQPDEKKKNSPPAQFSPQPALFSSVPSASPRDRVPPPLRQKRPLDPAFLQNLPMRKRSIVHSVFAMINGNRGSEEIKAQLRLSPGNIDDALNWLRMLDVIE
jgi:hypothetical protein